MYATLDITARQKFRGACIFPAWCALCVRASLVRFAVVAGVGERGVYRREALEPGRDI